NPGEVEGAFGIGRFGAPAADLLDAGRERAREADRRNQHVELEGLLALLDLRIVEHAQRDFYSKTREGALENAGKPLLLRGNDENLEGEGISLSIPELAAVERVARILKQTEGFAHRLAAQPLPLVGILAIGAVGHRGEDFVHIGSKQLLLPFVHGP